MGTMIKLGLLALIIWGLFFVLRGWRRVPHSGGSTRGGASHEGGQSGQAGQAHNHHARTQGGFGSHRGKPIRVEELVACKICGIYAAASVKKPCERPNCPRRA